MDLDKDQTNVDDGTPTTKSFTLTLSKKRTDMEWVSKIVAKLKELPLGANLRIVGKGQKQQFRPRALVELIAVGAGDPSLTVLDCPLRRHKDRHRVTTWGDEQYDLFLTLEQRCVLSSDNNAEDSCFRNVDDDPLYPFDDRSLLRVLEPDEPHSAPMCVVSRVQLDPRGREGVVQLTKSNVLTVEHYQYWRGYSDVVDMYLHPLDGLLLTVCFSGAAPWGTEQTTPSSPSCESNKLDVAFVLAMWRLLRLENIEREYLAECDGLQTQNLADSAAGGTKTTGAAHWHGDLRGYAYPSRWETEAVRYFQHQWMCRACPFDPTVAVAPASQNEGKLLAEWVASTRDYAQCAFLANFEWVPLLTVLVKEKQTHLLRCALEVLSKECGWEELPLPDVLYRHLLMAGHDQIVELCLTHPLLKHLTTPETLDYVVRMSSGKLRRFFDCARRRSHAWPPRLAIPAGRGSVAGRSATLRYRESDSRPEQCSVASRPD